MKKSLQIKVFFILLLTCSFTYFKCAVNGTKYAFFGEQSSISALIDDDAKAAALWMQQTYGSDFVYIPFNEISLTSLSDVKVGMIYYLTSGYSATPTNVSTMLPEVLRNGQSQLEALKGWVKDGGSLFIAGDATPLVFALGRVPADFTAPRAAGNYVYSEFGCANASGCLETNHTSDDLWGLGVRPANVAGDIQSHPIFSNLDITNGEYLVLNNAASREVRLVWWQHFDGILNPSCCGQDAAIKFEKVLNAQKFGTLRHVTDSFGYAAVLWKRTDKNTDAEIDANIPKDFKGSLFTMENTISGYEWDSNGTVNDYQNNIKVFTKNILDFLNEEYQSLSTAAISITRPSLSPNPVKDIVLLKSNEKITNIDILDFNGRKVRSLNPQNNNVQINVQDLYPGVYLFKLTVQNKTYTYKVIKK